ETSLKRMKTGYIDLIQLHNPPVCPDPEDRNSAYAALLEAKEQGLVRHIGITNHRTDVAEEAVRSGLYETLQYPLNYLSSEREQALIGLCAEHDVGLIAMKALSGGLLTRADAPFAWMEQYANVVPIWGIQRMSELEEFITLESDPPRMDGEIGQVIAHDLKELQGDFCRGCGYCLPCPQEITIPMSARMSLLLRRAPAGPYLQPEWQEKMERIETCIECGQCRSRCPYELDVPNLLRRQLKDYREVLAAQS
ncbi:MAG: aldo/keto reductase, partial [Eubacteriales bacterium]|nr:aldo/keto reductase [Eubacteriales bacterium]